MKIVLRNFLLASAMPAYLATTACSKPDDAFAYFMSKPQITAPPELQHCAVMVNREVLARRSWPEADFNISFDGLDQETRNEVFRVSHIESYRGPIGVDGNDFSFFIHANCASMELVGEYREQQ